MFLKEKIEKPTLKAKNYIYNNGNIKFSTKKLYCTKILKKKAI
jgi:hypothetical protein